MSTITNENYDRIQAILDLFGLTAYSLAMKIGINRPDVFYNIRDGKTKNISSELALKIQSVYTSLNLNWILTGEGEMIEGANNEYSSEEKEKKPIEKKTTHFSEKDYNDLLHLSFEKDKLILSQHNQIQSLQKEIERFKKSNIYSQADGKPIFVSEEKPELNR